MSAAEDPEVRAAVLASLTEAEVLELLTSSVAAQYIAADVILKIIMNESPGTYEAWEDFRAGRPERYSNRDRKWERRGSKGILYPRAICPVCEKRVPVHVRDDKLFYRSHGKCSGKHGWVETSRVVGWGTFEHLKPSEAKS